MKYAVVAAAILALAATASANRFLLQDVSGGGAFPYAQCARNPDNSKFSTPMIDVYDDGKSFMVTMKSGVCVNAGDKCCKADVHKLELNTPCDPCWPGTKESFVGKCLLKSPDSSIESRTYDAKVRQAPSGQGCTLYITGFMLPQAAVDGTTLDCDIDQKKAVCKTFDALTGGNPWRTALWDSNHDCCPVTVEAETCKSTQTWYLPFIAGSSLWDYTDAPEQAEFKKGVAAFVKVFLTSFPGAITAQSAPTFGTGSYPDLDPNGDVTMASITFTFANKEAGAAWGVFVTDAAEAAANAGVNNAECTKLPGQTPFLMGDGCGASSSSGQQCATDAPPPPVAYNWPTCVCEHEMGATIFSPDLADMGTKWLNITIMADNTPTGSAKCAAATIMDKAEFWFKEEYKSAFQGSYVSYGTVKDKFVAPSWGGANYADTYKVAKQGVTDQKTPFHISIKLKDKATVSWMDISAAPGGMIVVSLFDPKVKCCPTYTL